MEHISLWSVLMMLISVVKLNGTHQFMVRTDDVNQCGEIEWNTSVYEAY